MISQSKIQIENLKSEDDSAEGAGKGGQGDQMNFGFSIWICKNFTANQFCNHKREAPGGPAPSIKEDTAPAEFRSLLKLSLTLTLGGNSHSFKRNPAFTGV
jgi:hypothetical protein